LNLRHGSKAAEKDKTHDTRLNHFPTTSGASLVLSLRDQDV